MTQRVHPAWSKHQVGGHFYTRVLKRIPGSQLLEAVDVNACSLALGLKMGQGLL